jgi:hypothetical protein
VAHLRSCGRDLDILLILSPLVAHLPVFGVELLLGPHILSLQEARLLACGRDQVIPHILSLQEARLLVYGFLDSQPTRSTSHFLLAKLLLLVVMGFHHLTRL